MEMVFSKNVLFLYFQVSNFTSSLSFHFSLSFWLFCPALKLPFSCGDIRLPVSLLIFEESFTRHD